MSLRLIISSVCLLLSGAAAATSASTRLELVPYPTHARSGTGFAAIDPNDFHITIVECYADCDVLKRAADRYMPIILQPPGSSGTVYRLSIFENRINATMPTGQPGYLTTLNIAITGKVSND